MSGLLKKLKKKNKESKSSKESSGIFSADAFDSKASRSSVMAQFNTVQAQEAFLQDLSGQFDDELSCITENPTESALDDGSEGSEHFEEDSSFDDTSTEPIAGKSPARKKKTTATFGTNVKKTGPKKKLSNATIIKALRARRVNVKFTRLTPPARESVVNSWKQVSGRTTMEATDTPLQRVVNEFIAAIGRSAHAKDINALLPKSEDNFGLDRKIVRTFLFTVEIAKGSCPENPEQKKKSRNIAKVCKRYGARHACNKIGYVHLAAYGEAMLNTMEALLGDKWDKNLMVAWAKTIESSISVMLAGKDNAMLMSKVKKQMADE